MIATPTATNTIILSMELIKVTNKPILNTLDISVTKELRSQTIAHNIIYQK